MTQQHESSSAGESNLGPGVAPSFGDVPGQPFEHTPERIVLSSVEHNHLSAPAFAAFRGEFAHDRLGSGHLDLRGTGQPGRIHIVARVVKQGSAAMELEAEVRESWLARAVGADENEPPRVRIVRELVRLSELANQSTIRVRTLE